MPSISGNNVHCVVAFQRSKRKRKRSTSGLISILRLYGRKFTTKTPWPKVWIFSSYFPHHRWVQHSLKLQVCNAPLCCRLPSCLHACCLWWPDIPPPGTILSLHDGTPKITKWLCYAHPSYSCNTCDCLIVEKQQSGSFSRVHLITLIKKYNIPSGLYYTHTLHLFSQ